MGDAIKITFLTSKNDQHGDNSMQIIPERSDCAFSPIQLIRLYFWRYGLKFQGTGKTVNFHIGRSAGDLAAVGSGTLSRVNAKRYFQKLLFQHGFVEEAEHYQEKCLKVGLVTNTLAAGETLENVKVVGGWNSLTTPLHYWELLDRFRREVAARIPLGPPPSLPLAPAATSAAAAVAQFRQTFFIFLPQFFAKSVSINAFSKNSWLRLC